MSEEDTLLTISGVIVHVEKKHLIRYSERTICSWITRGRKGTDGRQLFLKSKQLGQFGAHQVLRSELDKFLDALGGG